MYKEVEGNLITLALAGEFDVITHGCNCLCVMSAGIAVPMKSTFWCNEFPLEHESTRADFNKLGQIDYKNYIITKKGLLLRKWNNSPDISLEDYKELVVVNSYTQFLPAAHLKPLDYEALTLCMRKINYKFKGKKIGLPRIGAGLAGGDWELIKNIIQTELKDCDVTVVNLKKP